MVSKEPGAEEEGKRRPMIGRGGEFNDERMRKVGRRRQDGSFTNVRLCRLWRAGKDPKAVKAANAACRPRLLNEIAQSPAVIALGGDALNAIYGSDGGTGDSGLKEMRGHPLWIGPQGGARHVEVVSVAGLNPPRPTKPALAADGTEAKPFFATFQPAFVLRESPHLAETYERDLAKAFRHVDGRLRWQEPEMLIDPTRVELEWALARLDAEGGWISLDVETGDGDLAKQPLRARLRCVGIANARFGVCIGFSSVPREPRPRVWRCPPAVARAILAPWIARQRRLCGFNLNYFDRMVMDAAGMPLPPPDFVLDLMYASHIADSELPNSLEFNQSVLLDSPKHKPVKTFKGLRKHDAWQSDYELAAYNLADAVNGAAMAPLLWPEVERSRQVQVYVADSHQEAVCVGLHRAGCYIDESERQRHRKRLVELMETTKAACRELAGHDIDPGSPDQIRDQLFDKWGLVEPTKKKLRTKTDKASTGIDALYDLFEQAPPPVVGKFIEKLILYRRAQKWISTYCDALTPGSDGRFHFDWSGHVQVVGRLSSRLHQLPGTKLDTDSLHSIIAAAPGNVLVYADMAQFHFRLIAGYVQDELWMDAFARGLDVHKVNSVTFSGKKYDEITDQERSFFKIAGLSYCYRATAPTILAGLRKITDPRTGERRYANRTLAQTEAMGEAFLAAHPKFPVWWNTDIERWKKQGWLESPVLGRRRYFKGARINAWKLKSDDEQGLNDILNFPILSAEGDIMGGGETGVTRKVVQAVPFDLYGPGLICHWHDSMTVEVEERRAVQTARVLEDCMAGEFRGVKLVAEAKIGRSLSKMMGWKKWQAAAA